MTPHSTIVVGVDGSESSLDALRYALAEGVRRRATVIVARAFDPPGEWGRVYGVVRPPDVETLTRNVDTATWQLVHSEIDRASQSAPDVDVVAVPGSAADVLIEQAGHADLLVVGHRGPGGVAATLLGSVALRCVLHAPCPVTVVRPATASL
ncbi:MULTISPECIES: universal stress protein [unclassified Pseudonocardia]|jgi:nucleotide-binding universal stress UspA family protein|uniref:universal stress protein n=1 Tax=unclassified Pseudonocardia TaxID=2619320 RepID=UPI0009617692|nr:MULTISPECIES: universal stress protein [unclassified Pseudonocardia]MBN9096657.1 universal stress protein [Pseudonocardia sp.]OJY53365.1 MAG: hypothetical protein BGP03_04000 [Pseudonocardia sp. 73-21]